MALPSFFHIGNRIIMGAGIGFRKPTVAGGVNAQYKVLSGKILTAAITGTSAGQLGHANGVIMVPAAATGFVNRLDFCIFTSIFATAAYTGGGNLSVNIGAGGAALTGVTANTVWCTNAATVTIEMVPLAATKNTYTTANPLNLVSGSAPTQPGTAAGVMNWMVGYWVIGPVTA